MCARKRAFVRHTDSEAPESGATPRVGPVAGARAILTRNSFERADAMMRQFQVNSYLFGGNAPYVEELYERYLDNPGSVPERWRAYFDQMQLVPAADGKSSTPDVAHAPIVESFAMRAKSSRSLRPTGSWEVDGRIWTRSSVRSGLRFRNWSRASTT
jgi:hypothetical protein